MVLLEAVLPHINQSAYIKSVSRDDAIFAMQKVTAKYVHGGSSVFMCLYDIEKALDSVEYCMLWRDCFLLV